MDITDSQDGGATYISTSGEVYNGAGLVVVENYNNHKGRQEPAVILFQSHRGLYQDLGGTIDKSDMKHKSPTAFTACREAKEESRNTISITNAKHLGRTFVTIYKYRAYFVGIKSGLFFSKKYDYNKKILDNSKISRVWKETVDVQRFYLSDLIAAGININKGNLNVTSAQGKMCIIGGRAKAILREGLAKKYIFQVLKTPIKLKLITDNKILNTKSLVSY
jgi:hypothetical protein